MTLSSISETFCISAGSALGREHARLHRNNQDASAIRMSDALGVLVVCDGCSSGAYSEVGARLGATWAADLLLAYEGNAKLTALEMLTKLHLLVGQSDAREFVGNHLLFTLVAAVITPDWVRIYGRGDGVFSINGALTIRDAGAENAPDYFAYALIDHARPVQLELWAEVPTDTVASLAIGTDGAVNALDLLQSAASERVFAHNGSWLQRQLWARETRLVDDTTIVLLRKKEAA